MSYQKTSPFTHIYAPWRDNYVKDAGKNHAQTCPFCANYQEEDSKNFILHRYEHCFVMLNLYPYTTGHLLVISNRHVASLTDLTKEEYTQLINSVIQCQKILSHNVKADGFNVGINQGAAAGAGVPGHLHAHVVPRISHDTGFMATTAATHVINADLATVYKKLKPHFISSN